MPMVVASIGSLGVGKAGDLCHLQGCSVNTQCDTSGWVCVEMMEWYLLKKGKKSQQKLVHCMFVSI